jgi:hypothetical protein
MATIMNDPVIFLFPQVVCLEKKANSDFTPRLLLQPIQAINTGVMKITLNISSKFYPGFIPIYRYMVSARPGAM